MSRSVFLILGLIALLVSNVYARTGRLRTLDGTMHEGNIILSPLGGLLVTLANGGTSLVPLANLASAQFDVAGSGTLTNTACRFIVLRNGSVLPAVIERTSPTELFLSDQGAHFKVAILDIAGILTRPGNPSQISAFQTGRAGVVLQNGDFMDGEFRGLDSPRVATISTVLFGNRRVELGKEATGIVLRAVATKSSRYQVLTVRGGAFCSKAVPAVGSGDVLIIIDPLLGENRVPFNDIREITTTPK